MTIRPERAKLAAMIMIQPRAAKSRYVVYRHFYGEGLAYIGTCKLSELTSAPDAQTNSLWMEQVLFDTILRVEIISIFNDPEQARALADMHIATEKPYYNLHGKLYEPKKTRVRSSEGLEFDTAAQAARHYGASQEAMSSHLNRRPGYQTVKGFRFERIYK